jgi:adenylosuccinate lyase
MIKRYTLPEMGRIWTIENKYRKWLEIEILAAEAEAQLGLIPTEAAREIKEKATFDVKEIAKIEERVEHDVIAFLTNVGQHVGPAARYLHFGLTSSDVVDTALSLLMRDALDILVDDLKKLIQILREKAFEYKEMVTIGRTHGIHAEPMVFGLKFANWAFESARNLSRLVKAREVIAYGKISGPVGTYSNVPPEVEKYVCKKLGLKPAPVSSQVLQRDRHAEYMTTLAICAATVEKIATEIRNLQRTDILEAEEPFGKEQKGSSAMPHKRNPIICERLCGLARLIRSNAQAALENVALWHERDISHSSLERVIIPDSSIALDYMLQKISGVIKNLVVYPQRMKENLAKTRGLVFSQKLLLALVEKGLAREEAYRLVQRNAFATWQCWQEGCCDKDFQKLVLEDKEIARYLSQEEIKACFDLNGYLQYVDRILERLSTLEI